MQRIRRNEKGEELINGREEDEEGEWKARKKIKKEQEVETGENKKKEERELP